MANGSEKNKLYLDFLRFSIHEEAPVPEGIENMDWDGLLQFALEQAIIGVLFHGLKRLENHPARPNKFKIIAWYSANEEVVAANRQVNKAAAEITLALYKKENVKSCVLKGQGNAMMYPDPMMRMSGDIDLWTNLSTDELLRLVMKVSPDSGIEYHHVDFPVFSEVETEIHMTPSFMGNLLHEWRMRKYFNRVKEQQFSSKQFVMLPEGAGKICVPTDSFNRVFQLSHVMHHFFFEGVGFRQVLDYYYLLRRGFTPEERDEDVRVMKRLGMKKFCCGMMWLMKEVLGLEEKFLLTAPNEKVGRLLLDEILQAGNFGFHDERYQFKGISLGKQYLLETWRNMHFAWQFPSETIWGRPVSRWWHMIYKWHLRRKARKIKEELEANTPCEDKGEAHG